MCKDDRLAQAHKAYSEYAEYMAQKYRKLGWDVDMGQYPGSNQPIVYTATATFTFPTRGEALEFVDEMIEKGVVKK
jgi:hypothetical protein